MQESGFQLQSVSIWLTVWLMSTKTTIKLNGFWTILIGGLYVSSFLDSNECVVFRCPLRIPTAMNIVVVPIVCGERPDPKTRMLISGAVELTQIGEFLSLEKINFLF